MPSTPLLYQLLYVSSLHPDQPLTVVANIAHRSRSANAARGLTSMLIFDGQRFCQILEGDHRRVLSLAERISNDPRHQNVEVLHHGPLQERRFDTFRMVFTSGDDDSSLPAMAHLDGITALTAFDTLRAQLPL